MMNNRKKDGGVTVPNDFKLNVLIVVYVYVFCTMWHWEKENIKKF